MKKQPIKKEPRRTYIPLFYTHSFVPNRQHIRNMFGLRKEITPSTGIELKDLTSEKLDIILQAMAILEDNNVYFFQEE